MSGAIPEVYGRDEQQCQALFGALLKRYPHYLNLLAVTTKGEVFCSAVPRAGPQSVADRDWFQRVLQTRSFVVSEYEVDGITQRGTVVLAHPVLGSAELLSGVAAGMLDPVYLSGLAVGASLPLHRPSSRSLIEAERSWRDIPSTRSGSGDECLRPRS